MLVHCINVGYKIYVNANENKFYDLKDIKDNHYLASEFKLIGYEENVVNGIAQDASPLVGLLAPKGVKGLS